MKQPFLIALPALALLAFAPAAKADRFYFGPADTDARMVEGAPDFVEGVLLSEEDGMLVIRVEGGEMRVPKASVRKVEADGLTVEAIEKRESDAKEFLAEANALRGQMLAAEAAARRDRARDVAAAEASARRAAATPAAPPVAAPVYDPVLHVAVPPFVEASMVQKELGGVMRRQLQREASGAPRRR